MKRALKAPDTKTAKQLEMMQHPETWPRWPFLPLIRHTKGLKPFGEEGLLYDDRANQFTVYFANLYLLPKNLAACASKAYLSYEAILADGWEVD
jgi:hypothetical protein